MIIIIIMTIMYYHACHNYHCSYMHVRLILTGLLLQWPRALEMCKLVESASRQVRSVPTFRPVAQHRPGRPGPSVPRMGSWFAMLHPQTVRLFKLLRHNYNFSNTMFDLIIFQQCDNESNTNDGDDA